MKKDCLSILFVIFIGLIMLFLNATFIYLLVEHWNESFAVMALTLMLVILLPISIWVMYELIDIYLFERLYRLKYRAWKLQNKIKKIETKYEEVK